MATATASAVAPALAVAQGSGSTSATAPHDYTQGDVDFVQGMIMHHAQAVVMSDWAPTHGARPDLQVLCKRIALSQRDEIAMMQAWLEARHLPVPDPLHMLPGSTSSSANAAAMDMGGMKMSGSEADAMNMPGMDMGPHPRLMAGMLTAAQMRQLDAAHGTTFDSLYLTGMIRHHQGALGMVADLFATPSGGQQPEIFNFAIDVDASQRAEIARMQAMLNTLTPSQPK